MLTLVTVGFVAGLVTGLSPCVLPVLPGVLAASTLSSGPGADGATPRRDRRRPWLVVAGLLTSFAALTVLGAALVTTVGIPEDWLRATAVAALVVVGIGLLVPAVGQRLESAFWRLPVPRPARGGSAFLFGLTFGAVFVPCAGPVLAAITVLAATQGLSSGLLALTLAFAAGLAIPLLMIAHLGSGMGRRLADRMPAVRRATGAVLVVTGVALALGLAEAAQRAVPGYVASVQRAVEDSDAARSALDALGTGRGAAGSGQRAGLQAATLGFDECARQGASALADCGPAPELSGIAAWLNTPDDQPLTLAGLRGRGRVVLVDFWTYSCINCQRTLPHLTAWDEAYRDAGLTIVGVHSPEFAFERERDNVAQRAADFGIAYPIALDSDFATWAAFGQRYWPAKYLIDAAGRVRMVHYGEGSYAETERLIRQLLAQGDAPLPHSTGNPPVEVNEARTAETYLGYERARAYAHSITRDAPAVYTTDAPFGRGSDDRVTLKGTWTVRDERIDAGPQAGLILDFSAARVFLVLGGEGIVRVVEADATREVRVSGPPTLYELRSGPPGRSRIGVYLDEGMSAYAFTFG